MRIRHPSGTHLNGYLATGSEPGPEPGKSVDWALASSTWLKSSLLTGAPKEVEGYITMPLNLLLRAVSVMAVVVDSAS